MASVLALEGGPGWGVGAGGYEASCPMDGVTVLIRELPHPFCLPEDTGKGLSAMNQEVVSQNWALLVQIWGFQPPEP